FFFQAEDGIRDKLVTGVQTCALPICRPRRSAPPDRSRVACESIEIGGGSTTVAQLCQQAGNGARTMRGGRSPDANCRTAASRSRSEERRVGKEWRSRGWT